MSKDPYEEAKGYVKSSPVGYYDGNQFPKGEDMANGYGIYDMAGNAWEWCWDRFGDYTAAPATNPVGPSEGTFRVARGGQWTVDVETGMSITNTIRCSARHRYDPLAPEYAFRALRCVRRQ